jgi:hypothetical protein
LRAIITTAPGMRPASISALSRLAISFSRSAERPTSSGLARGSGSPFGIAAVAAFAAALICFDMD